MRRFFNARAPARYDGPIGRRLAMGRVWPVSMSIVMIVLTLAPMQAWAGCAWVLWSFVASDLSRQGTWAQMAAYDTRGDCLKAARKKIPDPANTPY
jgi:hypothetical protein